VRTFQFSDDRSHKFWNIDLRGKRFVVTYGRLGTAGQSQTKDFADEGKARKEHDKLVAEKLAKGYVETTPAAKPAGSKREAMEAALVENPDDLGAHMAYADLLIEEGDPRGEYIQVQLALEDEKLSAAAREKLRKLEKALFRKHGRSWLGGLAPFLIDKPKPDDSETLIFEYGMARGWLDTLELDWFRADVTQALAQAPEARLLRRLILETDAFEEDDDLDDDEEAGEASYPSAYRPLTRSPYLSNVRVLQVGESVDETDTYFNSVTSGEAVVSIVKLMPRLEELYVFAQNVDVDQLFSLRTLTNLRVLQVYHMDNYPLARLAKNPGLGKLTHLLCHPHAMTDEEPYIRLAGLRAVLQAKTLPSLTHLRLRMSDFGDRGAGEIVASGILKRLKVLDVRNGCMSDKGAATLAACPDLKNLELLDVGRNCMTRKGLNLLRATGVKVEAMEQWEEGDEDQEYLFEGDGE
jgi:uncharacterized protein (TIGR02996 family)